MNKSVGETPERDLVADGGLFPIRTVSTVTGVNAITLRAWERRYGLIKPRRTESGHRLYSQEHIDVIQRVTELLEKGIPISQVKQKLKEEAQAHAPPVPVPHDVAASAAGDQWQVYLRRMFNAVIRFDALALDHVYNEALSLYPVDLATRQLIMPLLRQLGERWRTEKGAIAEEHFFGIYLRNKLGARFHHHVARSRGPVLVTACLPGELHEVGLMLFSLAALDAGFRVVLLGADLPLKELQVPVSRANAAAVVLSGSVVADAAQFASELAALTKTLPVPVFVGGEASVRCRDEIVAADAVPLGTDLGAALKRVAAAVPLAPA